MEKRIIKVKGQQGICPICGKEYQIGETHEAEWCYGTREWTCECGATGEEGWEVVFTDKFYDVVDGDGHPIEIQEPEPLVPSSGKSFVISCDNYCNGSLDYTDILGVAHDPDTAQRVWDAAVEEKRCELEQMRINSMACGCWAEVTVTTPASSIKQVSYEDGEDNDISYKVSLTEVPVFS